MKTKNIFSYHAQNVHLAYSFNVLYVRKGSIATKRINSQKKQWQHCLSPQGEDINRFLKSSLLNEYSPCSGLLLGVKIRWRSAGAIVLSSVWANISLFRTYRTLNTCGRGRWITRYNCESI